jgi:hypothetical protein
MQYPLRSTSITCVHRFLNVFSLVIQFSERALAQLDQCIFHPAMSRTQSTLSGAIDIICIEDGDQMVSTPFHVRFGKLQVLHTNEKMVLPPFPPTLFFVNSCFPTLSFHHSLAAHFAARSPSR